MHHNLWPHSPSTRNLKASFKAIGKMMSEIALRLACHCDAIAQELHPNEKLVSLFDTISKSQAPKGRLLHYFPCTDEIDSKRSTFWCGYHNDHGTITGLLPAEYYMPNGGPATKPPKDQSGSLYVLPSGSKVPVRAHIPSDCVAFQIGESAQIVTGGALRATPHFVSKPVSDSPVARVTLAVFLQPNPWDILQVPKGADLSRALHSDPTVPLLTSRFNGGDSFGTFAANTVKFASVDQSTVVGTS